MAEKEIDFGTFDVWLFEDSRVAAAIRHIAEPGNKQNLDRLHMYLSGEPSDA